MDQTRRALLATIATAAVGGCTSDGPAAGPTATPSPTPTDTPWPTSTPSPEDPELELVDCYTLRVDHPDYEAVAIAGVDGTTTTHDGPFSGTETFTHGSAIAEITVEFEEGAYSVDTDAADVCPTTPVPSFSLHSDDAAPADAWTSIRAAFWHQTGTWIARSADAEQGYAAHEGFHYLVVQFDVSNTGDRWVDLGQWAFLVEDASGAVRAHQPLDGLPSPLDGVRLSAGGRASGWVVFEVPDGTTEGTLRLDQSAYNGSIAVDFVPDRSLDVGLHVE